MVDEKVSPIYQEVHRYKRAVETQDKDTFFSLWATGCETSLISLGTCYRSTDRIYQDFLLGGIQKTYSSIELDILSIEGRLLSEDCAVAIFSYRTRCIRRETGEPYGIAGLETQVFVKEGETWKLAHVQYAKTDE